ncbi:MAG TPA: hypothetical protein VGD24_02295 [Gallionella sp.]
MKKYYWMQRHCGMLRFCVISILLSFASGANAALGTTSTFLSGVQKNFISNTLLGSWESTCTMAENDSSYSATYEFTDMAKATLTTYQYADSLCISATESTKIEGSLSLQGLTFDKFGRYVYVMSILTSTGETHPLSLSLEQNSLLVHQSDTAQPIKMSPKHQGENK